MSTIIRSVQKINMAAASDVGTVRKENEDFYYYSKMKNFFVVCDGMGGHEKGALASRMAGETLRDIFFNSTNKNEISINNKSFSVPKACEDIKQDFPEPALDVVAGIRLANRRIISNTLHNHNMKGMGTTVICVRFIHDHSIMGHMGDSRVYRLRKGELQLLTTDHSWLNELLEDNEINNDEVKNFKKKNVLTRALGMSLTLKIDLQIHALEPDDLYLICSDGLYNALEDELIKSILAAYHGSLQNKVSNLVERAKNMDGSDNITAGVIHISGLQEIYPSQINEKYTIPEESEEVINYLDQKAKEIYPVRKALKNNNSSIKLSLISALAVILLIIAFFLFRTENAQNQNNNIFESA